jgi:bifunctional pyridoxal-dependent enzyme with beta-cystathionase and maltose regulon repressor activities
LASYKSLCQKGTIAFKQGRETLQESLSALIRNRKLVAALIDNLQLQKHNLETFGIESTYVDWKDNEKRQQLGM